MARTASSPQGKLIVNIVLAVVIVAVALGAWLFVSSRTQGAEGRVAVVHDGDGGITELPLDVDASCTITTSYGTNVVVVEDGAIRVDEADCPNQDCVEQGAVADASTQIICLPHELWIEIVDDSADADGQLDVVTS